MTPTRPSASDTTAPTEPPRVPPTAPVIPPILPVLVPLVVAALVLSIAFARWFPTADTRPAPSTHFTDITGEAGLARPIGTGGGENDPTTLGGAVVVLDYDNDGLPDLFFVGAASWPWQEQLAKTPGRSSCALYHNDGHGRFSDVTLRAGLDVGLQGMSAAAGDYDNDGNVDLFIACVGGNHLFRNRGQGHFEDVTDEAGVRGDDQTWSSSATWIDVDRDGRLDLVVAHYARWPAEVGLETAFMVAKVGRSYGTPTGFMSAFPSVYRNLGGGRFALVPNSAGLRDVDAETGLPVAKPLAVVPVDANGDEFLDLLFSYHTHPATLFINRGDGTFRRWNAGRDDRHEGASAFAGGGAIPLPSGVPDERLAAFEAAARVTAQPTDAVALAAKLAIAPADYDLDGRYEYVSGEGLAEPDLNRIDPDRSFAAEPQLYWNTGRDWKPLALTAAAPVLARGIAVADFDGDGDLDVVIAQHAGPPLLLRNDQRLGEPWLRVRLVATRTQHEAGGARVEVQTPRRVFAQTVAPAMGYMAQSDGTLTFGLGEDARVRKIVVHWPSGQRQELRGVKVNQTLVIREP